ncbi:MAG: class I SAM-dependent methyltransferase [Anaerolineae bacterium]|nr:class I SAM-dependent methyltransferase [Anaerolineae bacterium]
MTDHLEDLLEEQKAYYQARANEYDEWFYRRGRYDHGPEQRQKWESEIEQVRQALADFQLTGHVLDIAAGTGIWTQELLNSANHVTVVDSSEEMLAVHRQKVQSDKITYTLADLFYWQPVMAYDAVFMGFWLSHVPPALLYDFIGTIAGALKRGGKLFFVDSSSDPGATAKDMFEEVTQRNLSAAGAYSDQITMRRRLNDGREFQIVKIFYRPDELIDRFQAYNLDVSINQTENFFLYGWGTRRDD